MKIEILDIEDLKPYENNAKMHPQGQVEQIKDSIREFGFNDVIGIDENNQILEGHGRYMALKQMGVKKVPCVRICGLTEEEKKAYILIHNKLTMNTGFDIDKLQKEIEAIKTIDMSKYDFEVYSSEEEKEIDIPSVEILTIVLNLNEDQFQTITEASEIIEQTCKEFHNYGNPNKRSNLINEIIYQWAEKRGIIQ